ncbi:hypothetical protein GF342_00740, partial [Candidatus Woesearchaeota archaeon]|nr:hypothetical protein [Candidatus Woesearchaeota archaeon]
MRAFILFLLLMPVAIADTVITGADGVPFAAQPTDVLTFTVTPSFFGQPSPAVARTLIRITREGVTIPIDTCTYDQGYTCTAREVLTDRTEDLQYTIETLSADQEVIATETVFVSIDTLGPAITEFLAAPQLSNEENFTLIISAQDYASQTGNTQECGGISRIEVQDNERRLTSVRTAGDCTIEEVIPITLRYAGTHTICAEVYDSFDQSTSECIEVVYDNVPPRIANFGFVDNEGNFYSHVTSTGTRLSPAIRLTDDAPIDTVSADLSAISEVLDDIR